MAAIPEQTNANVNYTESDGAAEKAKTIGEELSKIGEGASAEVTVNTGNSEQKIQGVAQSIDGIDDKEASITADTSSIDGSVKSANDTLDGVEDQEAIIDAKTSYLPGDVARANELLGQVEDAQADVTADTSTIAGSVATANSETAKTENREVQITADTSSIPGSVASANTETDKVQDQTVIIDADTKYLSGDVAKANETLGGVEDVVADITADTSTLAGSVVSANAETAKLEDRVITITTVTEPGEGGGGLSSDASSGTSGFSGSGGKSGAGGGRSGSNKKPGDIINTDSVGEAIAQLTFFEVLWLRIQAWLSGKEYVVPDLVSPTAQAEVEATQAGLDGIANTNIPDKTISIDDTQARTDVQSFEDRADDTVEKKINVTYSGAGGEFAKGTKNSPEGTVLVDEKGAELIEHKDGTYEIGSNEGPRFTSIEKGSTIHTADETKKILRRGVMPSTHIGNRFASGTLPSPVSSTPQNTSSSKKNTSKKINWKKYIDKLFDWIEIRLKRLQEVTDKWTRQIERAVGSINKNKAIDSAIASISNQIAALQEAGKRYTEQAAVIAKKTKLSQGTIDKIQNGTIDIASYSKKDQERIKAYQEWWEKAQAVKEEIEDLKDKQTELNHQKLDNIIKQYDDMIQAIDSAKEKAEAKIENKRSAGKEVTAADYKPAVDAQKAKIAALREEYNRLKAEFDKQVQEGTLVVGSEAYNTYLDQLTDIDTEVINATTDLNDMNYEIEQIAVNNLNGLLTALQSVQNVLQGTLDLINAQGRIATTDTFKQLIANGMQQIANLQQQNDLLRQQQQRLDKNSDKYREIQEQIDANSETINGIKVSQEEWNDSILDLRIDELTRMKEELEKTNDEYERQKDIQEAIEDLERAKSQRKIRILENGTFKYVADTKDVADKQRALDQKLHEQSMSKIDEVIEAIEDMKETNNVYADEGMTRTSLTELFPGSDLETILAGVMATAQAGLSLSELAQSMDTATSALIQNSNNSNTTNFTVSPNAIVINTTQADPEKIADYAIKKLTGEMDMAFTQEEAKK